MKEKDQAPVHKETFSDDQIIPIVHFKWRLDCLKTPYESVARS